MPPQSVSNVVPLDAANPVVFVGLLIGGLMVLISIFNTVDQIIHRRKRVPTIESEFARKEELAHLDRRLTEDVRSLRTYMGESHGRIHGRIDGLSKELKNEIVDCTGEVRREIEGKITILSTTINQEFRDLNRALGKAEGKLEDKG